MQQENNPLQELKLLNNYLKRKLREHKTFKRIYESNNKDKIEDDNEVVIITDESKSIFSNISEDVIKYFREKGFFNDEFINTDTRTISINNYCELLDTIRILIDFIEFGFIENSFKE